MLPDVETRSVGSATVDLADALDRYAYWPAPTVIIVDGPYGLASFPGDPPTVDSLPRWYAPHAAAWSRFALPSTSLWFWGTELAWATVHPVLNLNGWDYRTAHVWDKGKGHIAGNVNSLTVRKFPVVTELVVHYERRVTLTTGDGRQLPMKEWLRAEWLRSGLPLNQTNVAAGVANAATRKWFTADHLWYYPPPNMMAALVAYANLNGRPEGRPYFSLDATTPVTAEQWATLRSKWHHTHGITNVWSEPAVRGEERLYRNGDAYKVAHMNQKPLRLNERIVQATSDPGDVVWEPFGGLCTGTLAALRTGRLAYAAEIDHDFYRLAITRLTAHVDAPQVWLAS
jgi:site-specific DNA-methyltransferase (adenine-specific)